MQSVIKKHGVGDGVGTDLSTTTPPPHHNRSMALFWDHPGEPVPEENFWTLWCKGRLTAVLHAPSPYHITCQQQVGFYHFGAVGFSRVRVRIRISVRIMVRFSFSDRVGAGLPNMEWVELCRIITYWIRTVWSTQKQTDSKHIKTQKQ